MIFPDLLIYFPYTLILFLLTLYFCWPALGIASARLEIKPYDKMRWLYVDEVDVCADQRKKGAGKAIMRKLIEIARDTGCEEVWLGTEVDNQAVNALYRSLDPDDVAQVIGYAYKMD